MKTLSNVYFGMSVDDVALRHWSTVENFQRLCSFFAAEQIPATFFVVPFDEDTGQPFDRVFPEYVPAIQAARAQGSCVGQHGLSHNRFELGIPPAMILDLPHEADNKRFALEHQAEFAQQHRAEKLCGVLRQGRDVLEHALGFEIEGFRSPSLQESPGMFAALARERYRFDSSQCLQETGWDYLLERFAVPPREITRERWLAIRAKCAVPILPLTCDYTWYLDRAHYERMFALARHDYLACVEAGIPFVTVCHVNPVWDGCGEAFLRELYAFCRADAQARGYELEFTTLDRIAEKAG